MHIDPSGYLVVSLFVVTAVVGALIGGYNGYKRAIENGDSIAGGIISGALTGGAVGFALGCGVVFLGPVIAGTATASGGTMAAYAFGITSGISFLAGAVGYVIEERMNNREIKLGNMIGHGFSVTAESMISFGVGGLAGSMGTIGSLDFGSRTWIYKQMLIQDFTFGFKHAIDKLRYHVFD